MNSQEDLIEIDGGPSGESEPEYYFLPDGRKLRIGLRDLGFFRDIQALPAVTKISMMNLTHAELEEYLIDQRQQLAESVSILLSAKWKWRETGERALMTSDLNRDLFGLPFSNKQIIEKVKGNKLNRDQVQKIVQFYENGEELIPLN